jgi:hypothetical protein
MITDSQIRALRTEARNASDFVQAVICDVALEEVDTSDPDALDEDGLPDYSGGGHSAGDLAKIRRWLRATADDARAECERVIGGFE